MKNICINFQVHQPFRLKNFPFFNIGESTDYYDGEANKAILKKSAYNCYLPANRILLELIRTHGECFRVSFSISGTALDLFEQYMPELIHSFRKLSDTGNIEFLGETYSHSLSSLKSRHEFIRQSESHKKRIEGLFGQSPAVFRNTDLIYADFVGDMVYDMGYRAMLAEGADHILGWKSPNFLYKSPSSQDMKLLLRNYRLSEDIALRFTDKNWNEWPLTADKFLRWLNAVPKDEDMVNLFIDYGTFGDDQWNDSGICDFLKDLPQKALRSGFVFTTPSQATERTAVDHLSMPNPVSSLGGERDLSAWLGNDMQQEAFLSLYALEEKIMSCNDKDLHRDWLYLQASDHFYYMDTKVFFADEDICPSNPYSSPFNAFINYMNILSDFEIRIGKNLENQKNEISTIFVNY